MQTIAAMIETLSNQTANKVTIKKINNKLTTNEAFLFFFFIQILAHSKNNFRLCVWHCMCVPLFSTYPLRFSVPEDLHNPIVKDEDVVTLGDRDFCSPSECDILLFSCSSSDKRCVSCRALVQRPKLQYKEMLKFEEKNQEQHHVQPKQKRKKVGAAYQMHKQKQELTQMHRQRAQCTQWMLSSHLQSSHLKHIS